MEGCKQDTAFFYLLYNQKTIHRHLLFIQRQISAISLILILSNYIQVTFEWNS